MSTWRAIPTVVGLFTACLLVCACRSEKAAASIAPRPPNVVIIFTDDQGYQDVGCFGSKVNKTPNLDNMAAEGMRFTDFYVGQAVCSASRAALLTGCYPNRVGILGALGPFSKTGLNSNEVTIARMLKGKGYSTAMFGKWHLGDSPEFLPTRRGFDEYFGLPYSNDMWPNHPTAGTNYPALPLIQGEKVVQLMPDQTQLTTWYTEHAVDFIKRKKDSPFFLYVAHNMPHVPLFVSSKFLGKSGKGLYADVIMEIDWSVGQILAALKDSGVDENTLVIFTSDNGPWLVYGNHSGHAAPLREGKATTFDGGLREPCIMRWPGRIPAGSVCREVAATIDLLPTIARLTGAALPPDRVIDGRDIWPLMSGGKDSRSPHEAYYFYWGGALQAIRSGPWKLHFPHDYVKPAPVGADGRPGKYATLKLDYSLYNLVEDVSESNNQASSHPDIVAKLERLAEKARLEMGDSLTGRKGQAIRPAGQIEIPTGPPH